MSGSRMTSSYPRGARGAAILMALACITAAPGTAQQFHYVAKLGGTVNEFGRSLARVGDLDGDGVDELAVGAPGEAGTGVVRVLSGRTGAVLLQFAGTDVSDRYGESVASGGDVDGDGSPDLAIGAPQDFLNAPGYVELRSLPSGALIDTVTGASNGDRLGTAVAMLGDVDGDGRADVALGAPGVDTLFVNAGRVLVVGRHDGATVTLLQPNGQQMDERFGASIAATGDVDGDGVPDLVAGTEPLFDADLDYARVVSGSTGFTIHVFPSTELHDYQGSAVAGPGDVDRDGHADVLVAAPGDASAGLYTGRVRLHSGADGSVLHEWTGDGPSQFLGTGVAGVGDVDGDGWLDVALGVPRVGQGPPGSVRVHSGRDGSLIDLHVGGSESDEFGAAVVGAGDVDGDGFDDVAATAPDGGYLAMLSHRPLVVLPLLSVDGDGDDDRLGSGLAAGVDLDGDGVPDIVAGAIGVLKLGAEVGVVRAYSGADASVLWEVFGVSAAQGLGARLLFVGDLDEDGVPDLAAGVDDGAVLVLSGSDGATIRLLAPVLPVSSYKGTLALGGDLDHDGVRDLLVGHPPAGLTGTGHVAVVSPVTGAMIRTLTGPTSIHTHYGYEGLSDAGDVDGDGVHDVIVGDSSYDDDPGVPSGSGTAFVHSGVDGSVLLTLHGTQVTDRFGAACLPLGDLDDDGRDDVLVGAAGQQNFSAIGSLRAFSGATGSVLYEVQSVMSATTWCDDVAFVGDIDGDGRPDIGVSDMHVNVDGFFNGRVELFSSADGVPLGEIAGPALDPFTQFGALIAAAGDVDGDGHPDVAIAAPSAGADFDDHGRFSVHATRAPTWSGEGAALAGTWGTPNLWADGDLLPGARLTLKLGGTTALAPVTLVLGLSRLGAPFKGGTLVPDADLLIPLLADVDGGLALGATWPGGLPPGTGLWLQAWIADVAGPAGLAATNAVSGVTP